MEHTARVDRILAAATTPGDAPQLQTQESALESNTKKLRTALDTGTRGSSS